MARLKGVQEQRFLHQECARMVPDQNKAFDPQFKDPRFQEFDSLSEEEDNQQSNLNNLLLAFKNLEGLKVQTSHKLGNQVSK